MTRTDKKAINYLAKEFNTDRHTLTLLFPKWNWRRNQEIVKALPNNTGHGNTSAVALESINAVTELEEILPDKLRALALKNIPKLDIKLTKRVLSVKPTSAARWWGRKKLIANDPHNITNALNYSHYLEEDVELTDEMKTELKKLTIDTAAQVIIATTLIKHLTISQLPIRGR